MASNHSNHHHPEEPQEQETELASLQRVFHRVVQTENLEPILVKLLPRLILRLGRYSSTTSPTTLKCQQVLSQILSHIFTRIRNTTTNTTAPQQVVPLLELLSLLWKNQDEKEEEEDNHDPTSTTSSSTSHHPITMAFLKIGIPKCHKLDTLYTFLSQTCTRSRSTTTMRQHATILVLLTVDRIIQLEQQQQEQPRSIDFQFRQKLKEQMQQQQHAPFDIWMDLLLFTNNTTTNNNNNNASLLPCPGLSLPITQTIVQQTPLLVSSFRSIQIWILNYCNYYYFTSPLLHILLAASCSNDKAVTDHAMSLYQQYKQHSTTTPHTTTTMSDPHNNDHPHLLLVVLQQILKLCVGQQQHPPVPHTTNSNNNDDDDPSFQRSPLTPRAIQTVVDLIVPLCKEELTTTTTTSRNNHTTVAMDAIVQWTLLLRSAPHARFKLLSTLLPYMSSTFYPVITELAFTSLDTMSSSSSSYQDDVVLDILSLIPRLAKESDNEFLFQRFEYVSKLFQWVSRQNEKSTTTLATLDAWLEVYKKRPKWVDHPNHDSSLSTTTMSSTKICRKLLPVLWTSAQTRQPKVSRVAAARWASELIAPKLNIVHGAHLLCFLAGDIDVTVATTAREGLFFETSSSSAADGFDTLDPESSPIKILLLSPGQFVEMVNCIFSSSEHGSTLKFYDDFTHVGKIVSLRYLLGNFMCLEQRDCPNGTVDIFLRAVLESSLADYISSGSPNFLRNYLDQISICVDVLFQKSQYARERFVKTGLTRLQYKELQDLAFRSPSLQARRYFASSCGRLMEDTSLWVPDNPNGEAIDWFEMCGAKELLTKAHKILENTNESSYNTSLLHGAIFVSSHVIRVMVSRRERLNHIDSRFWEMAGEVLKMIATLVSHSNDTIGNAASDSLGIAFQFDGWNTAPQHDLLQLPFQSVLESLQQCLKTYSGGDRVDQLRVGKAIRASGRCLASTSPSSFGGTVLCEDLKRLRFELAESLFDLIGSECHRKDEEIALLVGDAIALYADHPIPADSSETVSILSCTEYDLKVAKTLEPYDHVLFTLIRRFATLSSPQKRTSSSSVLLCVVSSAVKVLQQKYPTENRGLVVSVQKFLEQIQGIFIKLLADPKSKHIARESCCLGLVACRGVVLSSRGPEGAISSETMNSHLLAAFGETTRYQGSAYQETVAQAAARRANEGAASASGQEVENILENAAPEFEIGGAAGMTEAALGAYREMASASISVGRPDLLYSLLLLSVSHDIWSTKEWKEKFNPDALLGHAGTMNSDNILEIRIALKPHFGTLLPRMLRACHDPNKETRDQMSFLLKGICGDTSNSRKLVNEYFIPILDSLLEDTSHKLWRARVGAVSALSELIVGKDWKSLGGGEAVLTDDDMYTETIATAGSRLLKLWRVVVRAVDDVRGAVRESGAKLGRSLRALTTRLCDPSIIETTSGNKRDRDEALLRHRDAASAAATALRWLTEQGLNQKCTDALGICLSTLIEVVQVVNAPMLEPIIGDLLRSLLVAISGMEPEALNYLQLRVSDQEGLERARIQLAQSGPIASAVTKCLELVPRLDPKVQRKIVSELDAALRLSSGFASRAATADAVSHLCGSCPGCFAFPGVFGTANPTVRLFRGLYYAMERERGEASKDKLCHAFGNLAGLCPSGSVRSLASKICVRYTRSTGGNNDSPSIRMACASSLRAIAVRASNQFAEGEVWSQKVLPIAYLGLQDPEAKIAKLWKEVWEEGGNVTRIHCRTHFGTSLEENILVQIVQEICIAIEDVSWARRTAGASTLCNLVTFLTPIEGDRGRRRAECTRKALSSCLGILCQSRLWTGKSSLVKTTCDLISLWKAEEESWTPVDSVTKSEDDLFADDLWFRTRLGVENTLTDEEEEISSKVSNHPEVASSNVEDGYSSVEEGDFPEDDPPEPPELPGGRRRLLLDGFCRYLLEESMKVPKIENHEALPYRAECLKGIHRLAPPTLDTDKLLGLVRQNDEQPLIVAVALQCLSLRPSLSVFQAALDLQNHVAWTVRESSATTISIWVTEAPEEWLRSIKAVRTVLDTVEASMNDRKFVRCRLAGLAILESLVNRAKAPLILDSVLPVKEEIGKILRQGLVDPQASVTSKTTQILQLMKDWP